MYLKLVEVADIKNKDECKKALESCGDILYSAVSTQVDNPQKAFEYVVQAFVFFAQSSKKFSNDGEVMKFLVKKARKLSKKNISDVDEELVLTSEQKDNIMTAMRVEGGNVKKSRRGTIIFLVCFALVIIAVVIVVLGFMNSDDFSSGWGSWFNKETEFRETHNWGH